MAECEKRVRKPNYKIEELEILVEEVEKNKVLLLGKLTDTVTNERKKKMWFAMAGRISAVGNNKRSPEEIRENGRIGRVRQKAECQSRSERVVLLVVGLE